MAVAVERRRARRRDGGRAAASETVGGVASAPIVTVARAVRVRRVGWVAVSVKVVPAVTSTTFDPVLGVEINGLTEIAPTP